MSNQPFDEEVINVRERPLSSDLNLASSYSALSLQETSAQMYAQRASFQSTQSNPMVPVGGASFIGSAFACRPFSPAGMIVQLDPGLGFFNDNTPSTAIGEISGLNDPSIFKPLSLSATEQINVPASDPTNARIDIVEVLVSNAGGRRLTDSSSRDVLDPTTGTFIPAAVFKTLSYNLNGTSTINGIGPINYKTGTPAGSPVAPVADAGYVKIAEITVAAGATSLAGTTIRDFRVPMFPGGYGLLQGTLAISGGATSAQLESGLAVPPGMCAAATYAGVPNAPASANLFVWPAATGYQMQVNIGTTIDAIGGSKPLIPQAQLPASPVALSAFDQTLLTAQGFVISVGQPVYKSSITLSTGTTGGFTGANGTLGFVPVVMAVSKNV